MSLSFNLWVYSKTSGHSRYANISDLFHTGQPAML